MKIRKIGFWIVLVLGSFAMGSTGLGELLYTERYEQSLTSMHYPEAFTRILGLAKVLGAIGLLIVRFRLLACVCLMAVLIGAIGSHLGAGQGLERVIAPAIVFAILSAILLLDDFKLRIERKMHVTG